MNTNRLIWFATTLLCGLLGVIVGRWLGIGYTQAFEQPFSPMLVDKPLGSLVVGVVAFGTAIVMLRVGSWVAERHAIPRVAHFQQLSAVDRVLGIIGALLGLVFGVLVTLPLLALPDHHIWLPVQLCAMVVGAVMGMALLAGLRGELLRILPQLDSAENAPLVRNGGVPKLLDTNIIIDGRMADLCKTGFIDGPLYVPSFVLDEVQYIADSADSMRRARGRRGLEVLNAMREIPDGSDNNGDGEHVMLQVLQEISPAVKRVETVDGKLVALAREMNAAIVTNDFNLNRVAGLQGVRVLNINEMVQALKPVVLPGEEMTLAIVKEGKEVGQGLAYLEDGTMVVVTDGQKHVGETCKVTISSVYQTVAGKMIFAEIKNRRGGGDDLFDDVVQSQSNNSGNSGRKGRR